MEVFGINHRLTTPYHPQANGLDDRYNQTLINSLSKFAQDNRTTWDEKLSEVVYAYNTTVQESTKYTPFQAMFGRVAWLPVDINASVDYDPQSKLEEYITGEEIDDKERETEMHLLEEDVKKILLMLKPSKRSTMT